MSNIPLVIFLKTSLFTECYTVGKFDVDLMVPKKFPTPLIDGGTYVSTGFLYDVLIFAASPFGSRTLVRNTAVYVSTTCGKYMVSKKVFVSTRQA